MVSEKKRELGSVMVIGGCGFLGHHVVRLLLRECFAHPLNAFALCADPGVHQRLPGRPVGAEAPARGGEQSERGAFMTTPCGPASPSSSIAGF